MKVVLDTNVFISAVFFGGVPGRILKAWQQGGVELVLSAETLEEYVEVLHRLNKKYPAIEVEPLLELLLAGIDMVEAELLAEEVCADPSDDKFIACGIAAGAEAIVSGDKHLLAVNGYHGLEVLNPADFVRKHL